MLQVENLTKTYKHAKTPAISGVSFTVKDGEVFGLVGKNGAGKSTALKCILGIHPFETGTIVLNGIDFKEDENQLKRNIGYVPDNHMVYEMLTGREYVNFMADVYGVRDERDEKINKLAQLFGLEDVLDKQIAGYSHGMHQKICIIGALVHSPSLWILDEPFLGLDHKSVLLLKKSIRRFTRDHNKMVLFSSHDLATVIKICNRVCVIDKGKVIDILDMSNPDDVLQLKKVMS